MKLKKALRITIAALTCIVAVGSAAKTKDSRDMLVPYDGSVAGSHLASGQYRVQWENHSPEATVNFQLGNKVVATVQGKVVDRGEKHSRNAVVYDEKPDGSRIIQEIRFKGSSQVIVFGE